MKKKVLASLLTVAMAATMLVGCGSKAEAPADALTTPVLYPVSLIQDKEASEDDAAAAEAFLEYIKSDDATKVFEKYGFTAYKADDISETDDKDAETTEEADDTETNAETETTEEAK